QHSPFLRFTVSTQRPPSSTLFPYTTLFRSFGHEINNSLAPIKSISRSLQDLIRREPRPPDLYEDIAQGLAVISARSEALARFMSDRKSTRMNSSHVKISYAVFCLKKKNKNR